MENEEQPLIPRGGYEGRISPIKAEKIREYVAELGNVDIDENAVVVIDYYNVRGPKFSWGWRYAVLENNYLRVYHVKGYRDRKAAKILKEQTNA